MSWATLPARENTLLAGEMSPASAELTNPPLAVRSMLGKNAARAAWILALAAINCASAAATSGRRTRSSEGSPGPTSGSLRSFRVPSGDCEVLWHLAHQNRQGILGLPQLLAKGRDGRIDYRHGRGLLSHVQGIGRAHRLLEREVLEDRLRGGEVPLCDIQTIA